MSAEKPTLDDHIRWICQTSIDDGKNHIKAMMADRGKRYTDDQIREALEAAQAYEIHTGHRKSLLSSIGSTLDKLNRTNPPAKIVTKAEFKAIVEAATGSKPSAPAEVTKDQPKDPAWDQVREVSEQLRTVGRLFLRGQVKLGMLLAALKKECGIRAGQPKKNLPESGEYLSWADRVKQETGYSRQSCDEFIRLYESCKNKLRTSKTLDLPAPVKKDAIALFRAENPLTLTDDQWTLVDQVIGSLTTGETQASLMQELGIISKPKPMPKGGGGKKDDDDMTAGQLAFHFFEAMAAPLINARTNPDYKKLLCALPYESDEEHPLSLATLEAEFRAALADIEEIKQAAHKAARGKTINV
jgi:hypothetical protein